MTSLTLSLVEIILLMLCGVTLGIVIFYIISTRRSFKAASSVQAGQTGKELENWKLKYFNDIEYRDKELEQLRHRVKEAEENSSIDAIESEELRKENRKLLADIEALEQAKESMADKRKDTAEVEILRSQNIKLQSEVDFLLASRQTAAAEKKTDTDQAELQQLRKDNQVLREEVENLRKHAAPVPGEKPDYIEQLRQAQTSLVEHNQKINLLLEQIDLVRETEEKHREIEKYNEELILQLDELKLRLDEKEKEVRHIEEKAHLTREMTSRLDNAYSEFNALQDKIHKLESQVASSKRISLEFEDLKESYYKVTRDFEEFKVKYNAMFNETQQLRKDLAEAEDRYREANFQRQQLQKRVTYLEELNNDMQAVSDANKKLESQLKRIGELESMINVISEERDELARRQINKSAGQGH